MHSEIRRWSQEFTRLQAAFGTSFLGPGIADCNVCHTQGETVGCLLDMASNQISYTVNGAAMGVAFELPAQMRGQPLYPAIALKGAQASVSFGGASLGHGPPGGFVGIADAPSSHLKSGLRLLSVSRALWCPAGAMHLAGSPASNLQRS